MKSSIYITSRVEITQADEARIRESAERLRATIHGVLVSACAPGEKPETWVDLIITNEEDAAHADGDGMEVLTP